MSAQERRAARAAARELDEPLDERRHDVAANRRAVFTVCLFAAVALVALIIMLVGASRQAEERRACAERGGIVADVHGGSGWVCLEESATQ